MFGFLFVGYWRKIGDGGSWECCRPNPFDYNVFVKMSEWDRWLFFFLFCLWRNCACPFEIHHMELLTFLFCLLFSLFCLIINVENLQLIPFLFLDLWYGLIHCLSHPIIYRLKKIAFGAGFCWVFCLDFLLLCCKFKF